MRMIDDVIAYVQRHVGFSPIEKLVLERRLNSPPNQHELDEATQQLAKEGEGWCPRPPGAA